MRLKSLYIGQYKNFRDFSLSFDGGSLIDVFVGKNGTGKSNLFEALIEIFRHIVEYDRDKTPVGLMNGKQLVTLLMEYNIGVRRMSHDLFELEKLPIEKGGIR